MPRLHLPLPSALALSLFAASLSGCSDLIDTSTNTATSVTADAIVLTPEVVLAGRACGVGVDAVYKYGVVASFVPRPSETATGRPASAAVVDCFADAAFFVGEAPVAGEEDVVLEVYAWNKASYDAHTAAIAGAHGSHPTSAAAVWGATTPVTELRCTTTRVAGLESHPECVAVAR